MISYLCQGLDEYHSVFSFCFFSYAGIIALFEQYYHYQLFGKMLMSFRAIYVEETISSIFPLVCV